MGEADADDAGLQFWTHKLQSGLTDEQMQAGFIASTEFYNNANGLPKGIYDRNQFGYSIGGPIVKNKLFFFENTEWTRIRSGANEVAYVPTPQFIAAAAPATRRAVLPRLRRRKCHRSMPVATLPPNTSF